MTVRNDFGDKRGKVLILQDVSITATAGVDRGAGSRASTANEATKRNAADTRADSYNIRETYVSTLDKL